MMIALRTCFSDSDLSQLAVYRHQGVDPSLDRDVRDALCTFIPNHLYKLFDRILILIEHSCAVSARNVVAVRRPETRIERLIKLPNSLSQPLSLPVIRRGRKGVVELISNG